MESIFSITENGLDESAYKIFTEELKESYGKIRVFIHPTCYPLEKNYKYDKAPNPLNFLIKTLTNKVNKKIPMVIFQDQYNWAEFDHLFKDLDLKRNIFVVKTKCEDPTPKMGWERLFYHLNILGVKEVIIGGMYLINYLHPTKQNRDNSEIRGCVNYALERLQENGFNTKVSIFTNPDTREIYNKKSLVT